MTSDSGISTESVAAVLADAVAARVTADGYFELERLNPWDSLKQIEVIFMLEEEFGVRLPVEEVANLTTLADLVEALRSGIDGRGAQGV